MRTNLAEIQSISTAMELHLGHYRHLQATFQDIQDHLEMTFLKTDAEKEIGMMAVQNFDQKISDYLSNTDMHDQTVMNQTDIDVGGS